MEELLQKSLGSYKHYRIAKDRVIIKTQNINKYEEYYVKFDNLGLDLTRKQTKSIMLLIPFYVALTGLEIYVLIDEYQKGVRFPKLLFWIGGVALFAAGAVYSFFQKTDKVFIQGGSEVLALDGSKPDSKTVNDFITSLQTTMKSYYRKRYAIINPNLDKESQIFNYQWLKEIEAITEDEYEKLVSDLKTKRLFE